MENVILVPWDFSEVAEHALKYAKEFAQKINGSISLVHVVKKEEELTSSMPRINAIIEDAKKIENIDLGVIVREGNIFKTITDVVSDVHAKFVVMGTHGMKGMQKFTGSWALKVIAGSEAPFVVVQEPPREKQFKEIVFPVDFRAENKEKLSWGNFLASHFNTKLHIVKPNLPDTTLKKRTSANLLFYKKYLDERNIEYEIHTTEETEDFAEATIKYARSIRAGLIVIMTTKNLTFQDYVLGANEQKIIANEAKIPVMCINPSTDFKHPGF